MTLCTFSAHYVVSDLHHISTNYDVPIYGCAYLYDGASADGTLIESRGVKMKIVHDDTAEVTWGGDRKYSEPVTRRRDYAGIGKVVPGSDVVTLPSASLTPDANSICLDSPLTLAAVCPSNPPPLPLLPAPRGRGT